MLVILTSKELNQIEHIMKGLLRKYIVIRKALILKFWWFIHLLYGKILLKVLLTILSDLVGFISFKSWLLRQKLLAYKISVFLPLSLHLVIFGKSQNKISNAGILSQLMLTTVPASQENTNCKIILVSRFLFLDNFLSNPVC